MVKVGHKQVVNMIRHGGNRLIIKVVTVSRTLDPEKTNPKKGAAQSPLFFPTHIFSLFSSSSIHAVSCSQWRGLYHCITHHLFVVCVPNTCGSETNDGGGGCKANVSPRAASMEPANIMTERVSIGV